MRFIIFALELQLLVEPASTSFEVDWNSGARETLLSLASLLPRPRFPAAVPRSSLLVENFAEKEDTGKKGREFREGGEKRNFEA